MAEAATDKDAAADTRVAAVATKVVGDLKAAAADIRVAAVATKAVRATKAVGDMKAAEVMKVKAAMRVAAVTAKVTNGVGGTDCQTRSPRGSAMKKPNAGVTWNVLIKAAGQRVIDVQTTALEKTSTIVSAKVISMRPKLKFR
jgi:hypothetical protein